MQQFVPEAVARLARIQQEVPDVVQDESSAVNAANEAAVCAQLETLSQWEELTAE